MQFIFNRLPTYMKNHFIYRRNEEKFMAQYRSVMKIQKFCELLASIIRKYT